MENENSPKYRDRKWKLMEEKTIIVENRMAEFRKPLELSQHRLGKKVGLTRRTIMKYENKKLYPTLDMAVKIARALEKDVLEVFILGNKKKTKKF